MDFYLPASLVVACLILGGPAGVLSLPFLLLLGLGGVLVVVAAWGSGGTAFQGLPLLIRATIAFAVVLPLLQMVPLPPSVWTALPGSALRTSVAAAFGMRDVWMPLTVVPVDTAYSAAMGLVMVGLLMSLLALAADDMKRLLIVAGGVLVIGAAVGVVQYASSGELLQFYAASDHSALIGFYSNKNHMGLALACAVPLAHVLMVRRQSLALDIAAMTALWLVLLALLVATNSRAGLLLGLAAIVVTAWRRYPEKRRLVLLTTLAGTLVVGAAAVLIPSVGRIVDRIGRSSDDIRGDFLAWSLPLAREYGIEGSGLGSFPTVFAASEKLEWVKPTYLNAAHNDYLQLIIEGGLGGGLLLVLLAASLATAALTSRSGGERERGAGDVPEAAWMGWTIIGLFALHSIVDYPARRAGTLVILVVAVACVLRPIVAARLQAARGR